MPRAFFCGEVPYAVEDLGTKILSDQGGLVFLAKCLLHVMLNELSLYGTLLETLPNCFSQVVVGT